VYGFIKGRVTTVDDMANPIYAEWIAKRLAKWHKVELPGGTKVKQQKLWPTMYKWLEQSKFVVYILLYYYVTYYYK
jgi:ethanolamine kinase